MTLGALPFAPKPRPCKHCGSNFAPVRPMQAVCSAICAARKVKADKAEERAQIRTRKEAIKTIPVLIREAQVAFNAWTRMRDAHDPCISCGAPPPDLSGLHAGRDAGHYRSIGSASHLRFHEDNCHAQCVHCNQWGAGRAVDYRIGLIRKIGAARVEALESNNAPRKWLHDELRAIKAAYAEKLKQLKREAT
jgi:hypothetical protein